MWHRGPTSDPSSQRPQPPAEVYAEAIAELIPDWVWDRRPTNAVVKDIIESPSPARTRRAWTLLKQILERHSFDLLDDIEFRDVYRQAEDLQLFAKLGYATTREHECRELRVDWLRYKITQLAEAMGLTEMSHPSLFVMSSGGEVIS